MSRESVSRLAWACVQTLDMEAQFTVPGLLDQFPHLALGSGRPAKSMARAMTWMLQRGRVEKVGRHRVKGDTLGVFIYRRLPLDQWTERVVAGAGRQRRPMGEEPDSPVTRTRLPGGITRVRFGEGWKPAHIRQPGPSLFGGVSSMVSEFL